MPWRCARHPPARCWAAAACWPAAAGRVRCQGGLPMSRQAAATAALALAVFQASGVVTVMNGLHGAGRAAPASRLTTCNPKPSSGSAWATAQVTDEGLSIGSSVTLSRLMGVLKAQVAKRPSHETRAASALVEQMKFFAGAPRAPLCVLLGWGWACQHPVGVPRSQDVGLPVPSGWRRRRGLPLPGPCHSTPQRQHEQRTWLPQDSAQVRLSQQVQTAGAGPAQAQSQRTAQVPGREPTARLQGLPCVAHTLSTASPHAGVQIRNTASVAGNIVTGSPISDLNPLWMATRATFVVGGQDTPEREVPDTHLPCRQGRSARRSCPLLLTALGLVAPCATDAEHGANDRSPTTVHF